MKGVDVLLRVLSQFGVEYIFGNPGTTESPLVDAVSQYPEIKYIVSLHEGVAVGMADAYAQTSGKLGVVNLHVAPGLGNGLGMLYNALVGRSPLLVTAGQSDTRTLLRDPLLSHDLVSMAAPLVKWSVQAQHADELPLIMHRAIKTAFDPPAGPVFVSLPMNIMEQESNQAIIPATEMVRVYPPDLSAIQRAAALLLEAKNPAIVVGDEGARSKVSAELTRIAEVLCAPVWGTLIQVGVGFPMGHQLYQGEFEDNHGQIRRSLEGHDAILLVGGEFFREVFYNPEPPFPESATLIQLENDPHSLARNFSPTMGVVASLRQTLALLSQEITLAMTQKYCQVAKKRLEKYTRQHEQKRQAWRMRIDHHRKADPPYVDNLLDALKNALPAETIVVGEPITASRAMFEAFQFAHPGDYLGSRGGGIGQALAGAPGVKLANPDRPVAAISGDGSALYSIQSLWSAAHYRIPVIFVILNNQSYRILKVNMSRYRKFFNQSKRVDFGFMDLNDPPLDFISLAGGMGVPALRVTRLEEVRPAVIAATAAHGPFLLDCIVDGGPAPD